MHDVLLISDFLTIKKRHFHLENTVFVYINLKLFKFKVNTDTISGLITASRQANLVGELLIETITCSNRNRSLGAIADDLPSIFSIFRP